MYPQIFPVPTLVRQRRALLFPSRTAQPGTTFAQAGAAMQSLAQELEREDPNENRGRRMRVAPSPRLR